MSQSTKQPPLPHYTDLPAGVRGPKWSDYALHLHRTAPGLIKWLWHQRGSQRPVQIAIRGAMIMTWTLMAAALPRIEPLWWISIAGACILVAIALPLIELPGSDTRRTYFTDTGHAFLTLQHKGSHWEATKHIATRRGQGRELRLALAQLLSADAYNDVELRVTATNADVAKRYAKDIPGLTYSTNTGHGRIHMTLNPDTRLTATTERNTTWGVTWSIDVDSDNATTALAAAQSVWKDIFGRTTATDGDACVFTVTDPATQESVVVDLSEH